MSMCLMLQRETPKCCPMGVSNIILERTHKKYPCLFSIGDIQAHATARLSQQLLEVKNLLVSVGSFNEPRDPKIKQK